MSGTERRGAWEWARLLRWPVAAVALAALLLVALALVLSRFERMGRAAGRLPAELAARAGEVARGLLTGNVTERFLADIPRVTAAEGGRLEVAIGESVETLSRTDERWAFWDLLPLGTTTVEIRVPVTYRYHVRLDEPWTVTVADGLCRVEAPALRPSLPPAIHTDRIERRAEAGWLRFDAAEQLAALERSLTPRLAALAGDSRHLALAREPSRLAVARFARSWLLGRDAWSSDEVRAISVTFADERLDRATALPPTLVLGD
ncbi:MAG TPA: hypothetical protein VLA75_01965 [Thermoanaerobaculia bacterium]|nr:hypothetical protein [Thermoanaerobaculia bacterium]